MTAALSSSSTAARTQLDALLAGRGDLWRGRAGLADARADGISSGFVSLDQALVQGGWPGAGLSEILTDLPGAGLGLILPALTRLSASRRWLMMVAPPLIPYAPALAARGVDLDRILVVEAGPERLWAMAQGLESGHCAMVIGWLERGAFSDMRRLQVLAAQAHTPVVLFRSAQMMRQASPAALRLNLSLARDGALSVTIIKQQGGLAPISVRV